MPYRIAFFSDTHIDYSAGRKWTQDGVNMRVQDGLDALTETVDQILESDIDLVIHGGDLFHTSIPTVRGVVHVREQFERLHKAGIKVIGITGNHDFPNTRLRLPATAAVNDPDRGIHILTDPMKTFNVKEGIKIHAVSHSGLLGTPVQPVPTEGEINLLISHGSADIEGHEIFHTVDSPAEAVIPRETLQEEFNTTLLGHYHGQGPLPRLSGTKNKGYYAGSALRRGFSDSEGPRGWLLAIVNEDGTVKVGRREISQRPQFDLPVINAEGLSGEEVEEQIRKHMSEIDWGEAPIVRQKVLECPLSTRKAVNTKSLNEMAEQAVTWQLEFKRPEATEGNEDDQSLATIRKASLGEAWDEFVSVDPEIIPKQKEAVTERGKELLEGDGR